MRAGGPGTQVGHLRWLLLQPPAPPAPRLPTAPPVALVHTRATLLLREHLLHAYAQHKYHECIGDDMTW
jgi:hypothetical protein